MAIGLVHFRISVFAVGLLLGHGCERKDHRNLLTDATAEITCPSLYQGSDSLADALAFIEVPADRLASSLVSVSKRGELANSVLFPGTNVTKVQARERGGFIGSDLEFLSFETAKGNVLYRHRVVLRKTPVSSNAGAVKGSD